AASWAARTTTTTSSSTRTSPPRALRRRKAEMTADTPSRASRGTSGDEQAPAPSTRDRDPRGRPANARPRDGLGRPLPRESTGVAQVPDGLTLPPDETLAEAQRLLDEGLPFHAHEVLEARWKAAPYAERDLWQGLAQLAVGLTHILRG